MDLAPALGMSRPNRRMVVDEFCMMASWAARWNEQREGCGAGIPTAQSERVTVHDYDYAVFFQPNFPAVTPPLILGGLPDQERFRTFLIKNQTWSMSPYLAALVTPTDRFFAQEVVACT